MHCVVLRPPVNVGKIKRELGVLPKFQSKTCLKMHEYPSADDFEGKKSKYFATIHLDFKE